MGCVCELVRVGMRVATVGLAGEGLGAFMFLFPPLFGEMLFDGLELKLLFGGLKLLLFDKL